MGSKIGRTSVCARWRTKSYNNIFTNLFKHRKVIWSEKITYQLHDESYNLLYEFGVHNIRRIKVRHRVSELFDPGILSVARTHNFQYSWVLNKTLDYFSIVHHLTSLVGCQIPSFLQWFRELIIIIIISINHPKYKITWVNSYIYKMKKLSDVI